MSLKTPGCAGEFKRAPAFHRKEQLLERHSGLKYKCGNRQFLCRGYYADTAGKNAERIAEYIKNRLKEAQIEDQMTMKEYIDPFAGSEK